jgi:NifU-like protein involved in Fe-S cluster formation
MNIAVKGIGGALSKTAIKVGMKLRKASPELLLVGGIIAGGAAIVTACKATKKVVEDENNDISQCREELEAIRKEKEENPEQIDIQELSRRIGKKKWKVLLKLAGKYAKAYGIPIFLAILSLVLVLASHGVLKKRYVSTTLAYKALDEAFKDYRERIKEAVGEEKELHYFNGTHEGGEDTVIDENGESHTKKIAVKDKVKANSPYEFDFNARTAPGNWEANSDYNYMFLKSAENYLNDLLNARGHVFMNEALDAVGLKRTKEGAVVGWIKGYGGDDYVDLGFSEYYTDEYSDAQSEGYLQNIHLNFNVDGLIWDKI